VLVAVTALAAAPVNARLLLSEASVAAKCHASIRQYLSGQKDLAITSQFISGQGAASLFGSDPKASIVIFAPTNPAWEEAAIRLKIDLASGSFQDGKELGAVLFYQILLAGKYSGPTIGLAKNLLKAGSRQTALGAVTGKKLPIRFSHKFGAVYATGIARGSTRLGTPKRICNSLIYKTSRVVLPTLDKSKIPIPS